MSVVKFLAGLVLGILLTVGVIMVQPKKPVPVFVPPPVISTVPVITSCVSTTYDQVVPVLDAGGSMLFYMDTKGLDQASDQLFDMLRRLAKIGAKGNATEAEMASKAIDVCASFVKTSGLTEIDGFGCSTIQTAQGRFHSKSIAHRKVDPGNEGLIWSLMQSKDPATRGSDLLKVMPANAAVVVGGDCNLAEFRNWLKKTLKSSGSTEAIEGFDKFEKEAADAGFSLDSVLASYGGRLAMVIAIDDQQKMPVPMLQEPIAMPMAALVVAVNDGKLFDTIAEKLTKDGKLKVTGAGDHRQILLAEGTPGLPPAFNPVLVQDGRLLVLATVPAFADSIFATRAKGAGLLGTPEFQDWSRHIGAEANGFSYISPAATAMFAGLRDQYLQVLKVMNPEAAAEVNDLAKNYYNLPTGYTAYTVDKKGISIKSNVQKEPVPKREDRPGPPGHPGE